MKTLRLLPVLLLAMVALNVTAMAQRRDPLTDKEVNQLRETAQEPDKRMHLLVTFTKARMEMLEHLRTDQNMANAQADKIGDLLDDIANIVDHDADGVVLALGESLLALLCKALVIGLLTLQCLDLLVEGIRGENRALAPELVVAGFQIFFQLGELIADLPALGVELGLDALARGGFADDTLHVD